MLDTLPAEKAGFSSDGFFDENSRPVDAIVWRKDLYPRFEPDPETIQRYAESLDYLPPIEVNQHNELIDGYHRWTAHKKAGRATVPVTLTRTESDAQLLWLAIERNATHGLQLSMEDKRQLALKLFDSHQTDQIAMLLSVSAKSVTRWTKGKQQAREDDQKRIIFDRWLASYTDAEIATEAGVSQDTVSRQTKEPTILDSCPKSLVLFSRYDDPDWSPPLYNIWTFGKNSNGTKHFGNTAQEIVDRLLYLYTAPLEIVVDPFAGGGSTIDVCKKRLRRYWASDRKPIVDRQDIRAFDIGNGPPPLHKRWADVSLMYLDPPYWRQAAGEYSNDAADLGNMSLEDFYRNLTAFVSACADKMRPGSHVALIIQPTQWRADDRKIVDHVFDLVQRLSSERLAYEQRIICPYSTEQYTPQMVEWAKANKKVLVLNRELIVWQVR